MLRKRLHSRMLGLLLAAVAIGTTAAPASAGSYTINSCNQSPTVSMSGWNYEETGGSYGGIPYWYTATDCYSYGAYRSFENTTIPGGAYSAWTFTAPANTYIESAKLFQGIAPRSPGAYDTLYAELEDGTKRSLGSYLANPSTQVGDSEYSMPQAAPRTRRIRAEMGCWTGASCAGRYNNVVGNEWVIYGAKVVVSDPSLPAFGAVNGTGWTPAPADGVSTITYTLNDTGAGVSTTQFFVDGIKYYENKEPCVIGKYVPCPLTSSGNFTLDTTRLAEGDHTVSLVALDGAGNATQQADKQLTVTVRRAPAASSSSPVTTTNPSWNGGGSPAVGDRLSGNAGGWSGDGNTYTYQWQRCDTQGLNCLPIDGATGLNYTPTSSDVGKTLIFCVTATNTGGSATSCSAPTPAVIAAHPTQSTSTGNGDRPGDATPASPGAGSGTPAPSTQATSSPTRGAANGSPASERVVLTAVTASRTSTQKVKYGKRVPITGRLVGPNGAPIAGAVLAVQVQTAVPGASMADAAQVTTAADGKFAYTAPAGPSRVIRFGYRAYTADLSFADTTDVRLLVSAGVTMRATPKKVRNTKATVFKGRLLGRPIARRGVVVDLQVFFRKQWRTFAAPRTNEAGVYRFKYRFMAGAATWRFRARVRKDSSYPYEIGYSTKPVKVRVTK